MEKPSIAFLRKVAAGGVHRSKWYTGGGMKYAAKGGDTSLSKHLRGGWVTIGTAEMGKPAVAQLTDSGAAILAAATTTED
jgi:hypothetical protein